MKRLVVIAEGETEESFVNNILIPYSIHWEFTIVSSVLKQNILTEGFLNIHISGKILFKPYMKRMS